MTTSAADRLDPVGRLRLPRRPTMLRATLAAVLLLTAAGVLYAGADPPPAGAGPGGGAAASPGPSGTAPAGPGPATDLDYPDPTAAGPRHPGPDLDPAVSDPDHPDPAVSDPDHLDPGAAAPGQPGTGRLAIPDGLVGVPVSLGDPARLAVLRAGDRVDLLAVPTTGGDPSTLASAAPVLAVDHAAATLLLAVTPEQARVVVATPATTTFAVIIRG